MSAIVNKDNWALWARNVAYPANPEDYVEAAVDRLMESLDPYVTAVKNVRSQFNALNGVKMIDFDCLEDKQYYESALDRYYEAIGKIQDEGGAGGQFQQMVEWLKLRMAGEFVRCPRIAREMHEAVTLRGKAAAAGLCFKASQAKIILILHRDYGVQRDQIATIWGGSASFNGKQARFEPDEITRILGRVMAGDSVDSATLKKLKQQLIYDSEGLGEIPTELRLGTQNFKQRQEEIDRYQRGTALYGLFNYKSGGVGLSLHHCDDLAPTKVRRKKDSGYAVEADIASIPTRPREGFFTPTFSAVELVQALGRLPRLTSLSDTIQTMFFYKGTIEVAVAASVSQKLRCLKRVIKQRESWEDIIMTSKHKLGNVTTEVGPDESRVNGSDLLDAEEGEEDDDNTK